MRGHRSSFQRRLLGNFLVAGVVPLVACVGLILSIFQVTLARNAQAAAAAQLSAVTGSLGDAVGACGEVLARLGESPQVAEALSLGKSRDTRVYSALYAAGAPLLRQADFSLYDRTGQLLYTTGGDAVGEGGLPADWGLLWAARAVEGTVCRPISPYGERSRGGLRLCRSVPGQGETVGYAVAQMGEEHLARLFEGKLGAGNDVLVLDGFWDQVYATPSLGDQELAPRLRSALLSGGRLEGAGSGYTLSVEEEPLSGFTLVLRQPKPVSEQTMRLFCLVAGASILLCLLLCFRFSLGFSRRIFEPIRALNTAMAQVEGGDLDVRLAVQGSDELSQLSGRFNRMTQRLKENLAHSLRQRQELGDAQIRMMQAQLNPHFLYNTLDTIKWLGKINQVEEIATISADLAHILRQSISASEFVPLREELGLLERYAEIQRIRFPGKFQYRAEVEEETLDVLVPKLMLQPLVENAVIHGFEDGSRGHVTVTARCRGEELVLTVRDDGMGLSRESRERFLSRTPPASGRPGHLGLYNVDAILRLHYGEDRGLRLVPVERGTCIQIVLPIRYQEDTGGDIP